MIKQIIGKENVKVGMKCFEVIQNKADDDEKIELRIFIIKEELRKYFSNDGYFIDYFMKVRYPFLTSDSDISLQDSAIIPNSYNNHKAYSYDFESELEMVSKMTYGEFKQFMNTNKGEKKMKEEIQYKIVDVEKDKVKIQITKQTQVCKLKAFPIILIKASNDFILYSDTHPDYYRDNNEIYLRGTDKEKDNYIINMPLSVFEKFKVAVEEYNGQNDNIEFKKALSNVSEKFDKWNDDMNNAYDDFEETLKKVKTIQEFHQLKFNFLEKILKELPISAKYCLDCELDYSEGDCDYCKFKEKNGVCEERNSKWYRIYELRNKLIDAIKEIVY